MNPIAVYIGSTVLYWSAIIIAVGLLAALLMSLALQLSNGGRMVSMLLFFSLTLLFSIPLCRILHWYCHQEQYDGFMRAVTDYSTGSYVLSAALPAAWIAAWIAAKLDDGNTAKLLDAAAPGAALAVAFIRLSSLFNNACRGKIAVTTGILQHLPLAAANTTSSGAVEFRFATFFVHFLLLLLLCACMLRFFSRRRKIPMKAGRSEGNAVCIFLAYFCASEFLMDSTRYDSTFFPMNGFVSVVQIFSCVCILLLLIRYSRLSVKANGFRFWHALLWVFFLAALAGVGMTEYLIQRHGDWYLSCYTGMTFCCLVLAFIVHRFYLSCCGVPYTETEPETETE